MTQHEQAEMKRQVSLQVQNYQESSETPEAMMTLKRNDIKEIIQQLKDQGRDDEAAEIIEEIMDLKKEEAVQIDSCIKYGKIAFAALLQFFINRYIKKLAEKYNWWGWRLEEKIKNYLMKKMRQKIQHHFNPPPPPNF